MSPSSMQREGAPTRATWQRRRASLVHVVDGDGALGREIAATLEARGLSVRVLTGGERALDELAVARPDLVILCAELPDVSGYAVCSRLKRNREWASIPVIFTSGRADLGTFDAHRRLWVRADAYLRKPFGPAALLKMAALLVELPPERPGAVPAAAHGAGGGDEVLEDGFEYLGGGAEPAPLQDDLVRIVVRGTAPAPAGEVLEEGFEYLGGGPEEPVLDDGLVRVVAEERPLDRASRTAPGRWKLPAGIGVPAS